MEALHTVNHYKQTGEVELPYTKNTRSNWTTLSTKTNNMPSWNGKWTSKNETVWKQNAHIHLFRCWCSRNTPSQWVFYYCLEGKYLANCHWNFRTYINYNKSLSLHTSKILSPSLRRRSLNAAPSSLMRVTKIPVSFGAWGRSIPPRMLNPRPEIIVTCNFTYLCLSWNILLYHQIYWFSERIYRFMKYLEVNYCQFYLSSELLTLKKIKPSCPRQKYNDMSSLPPVDYIPSTAQENNLYEPA